MKKYKEFINENINIKSNQVLRDLYNKFNALYFNSELPDSLEIKWIASKKKGGVVHATYNPRTKHVISIVDLCISNYRPLTDDKLNGLMLHEMIHVYLFHVNILTTSGLDKTHGVEFESKRIELEKLSGFIIPLVEDSMEIADHINEKTFDVLFYVVGGQILMSVFNKDYLLENKESVIKRFEYTLSQKRKLYSIAKIIVIRSSERDLLNYKCKRSLNNMTMYDINQNTLDMFMVSGELLYEC